LRVERSGQKDQELVRFGAVLAGARTSIGSALPKARLAVAIGGGDTPALCTYIHNRMRGVSETWVLCGLYDFCTMSAQD
jgi:hypothetical protein